MSLPATDGLIQDRPSKGDDMQDVWPLVHAERAALIEDLTGLDDAQWATPSLCGDWTVHDVVAHIVDTAVSTRLGFIVDMVRARFDFDRQNARGVERARGATPAETLAAFRRVAARTSTPPAPLDTRLVEAVVHGEDVRRPLGIAHGYAPEAIAKALRLQARTAVSWGGAQERVAGLRLSATDADLVIGDGVDVAGPALSLLLAASGRSVAIAELTGRGVALLASRI